VARALTVQRTIVTPPEREDYLERARRRREHYGRAGCRYWLFEEADLPGAFIEFTEAADAAALSAAHAGAPEPVLEAARVYQEVELP
jgi:hypothetical protein